ncbi:MAG: triose-phosphate isomerase [Spirochaetaceae bacterium]|nr:triose-phosphate isomerase [Spirochaetaceae bacterium]MCF7949059.1 triose-phosphate isomerase [Spirochaetia bacterium]MCF7950415.1 triose-phosphate isomerase [Spirochaetaceae bacterium]
MRKPYIAGNWKMHKTRVEARDDAADLVQQVKGVDHRVMIAPAFTSLGVVAEVVKGSNVILGAQNMAAAEEGAHTGEISPLMLKECGVETVILGHSERRHVYGETDQLINTKVKLALQHGFEVILCIGETLEEREAEQAEAVVKEQLSAGLLDVKSDQLEKVVIAYEPVWAIGTGKTATPEDADAIHKVVRDEVENLYDHKAAEQMIIQYGGSVKPKNIASLMDKENIDGALVGGASLKTETFVPIVKFK